MESPDDPRLWGFRTLDPGPDWNLLRQLLGDHLASFFCWTNAIDLLDNGLAHTYRHAATGRFLEVHEDGTTLEYLGGSDYAVVHPSHAIASAFAAWESHGPRTTPTRPSENSGGCTMTWPRRTDPRSSRGPRNSASRSPSTRRASVDTLALDIR